MPKVTITTASGEIVETTVSDDAAREFEDLPFTTDAVDIVTVTDDN